MANIFQTLYNSIFSTKNMESISKKDDAFHSLLNIYNEKSFSDFSQSEVIDISSVLKNEDAKKLISLYKVVDQPFLNYEKEVMQSVIALEVGEILEREGKFDLGVVYGDMERAGYDVKEVIDVKNHIQDDYQMLERDIAQMSKNENIVNFLESIRNSGSIKTSDLNSNEILEVVSGYFPKEMENELLYKECIKYKAGLILEEMGILQTGTTIANLKADGVQIDLLKIQSKNISQEGNNSYVKIDAGLDHNLIDLPKTSQEYERVESFVDKLPVNMPQDIAKELVDIYSQIVVSELDHAYRDTFDLTSAKNWSDFIPSLSDKAINYQGLSDIIGKEYDETISNEINQRSLSVAEMKENRLNESEINLLTKISKSGLYFDADIKDDNKQIVERYFAQDYKEQISAFAKDNFKLIGEIQGLMRLNAGELLEANGLKPKGSTAAELKEEGYNVELLRLDVKTNPLDKIFCEAVCKEDYSLLAGLHSNNYVPSEEVMKSLKKEGVTNNTMIAVEQILGLKDQGKSLNDLHLEQTHDHGEGKAMGSTVNELFNNL